jgi:hypothetical protein
MHIGTNFKVKPGYTITVVKGQQTGHIRQVQSEAIGAVITGTHSFGPYALERDFIVQGDATVTIAESDLTANIPSTAQAAFLDAIPSADADDSATIWNDAGVLKVSTAP